MSAATPEKEDAAPIAPSRWLDDEIPQLGEVKKGELEIEQAGDKVS